MRLHFRSNDLEGKLWQQCAAYQLRQALERLHRLVARVRVRLDNTNAPAGGVYKCCRVEFLVRGSSPVAVAATSRPLQDSVEFAASRVRQRVVVQLHRATLLEYQPAALALTRARGVPPTAGTSTQRRLRLDQRLD